MNMNWLYRFLGVHDKQQKIQSEKVSVYVNVKQEEYKKDMQTLQKQAQKLHTKTRQAHSESVKLNEMIDGITKNIAIASGGINK